MRKDQPTFSIIVPAHNRPDKLAKCLNALTSLSYPSDCFEVIVVDDGSTLPLEPVVAPFAVSSNIILLRQPNAGPATARNFGATKAKGTFLAFTDDDCAPSPDWLNVLANQFAKTHSNQALEALDFLGTFQSGRIQPGHSMDAVENIRALFPKG